MEILITRQREFLEPSDQTIKRKMEKVLSALDCPDKELSILLTSNDKIAQLNSKYLGREGPTNVIAFPMSPVGKDEPESPLLGDIVISVDTAVKEAEELGETLTEAIGRLLIHGLLHLLGYDHEHSGIKALEMENEERKLMKIFKEG